MAKILERCPLMKTQLYLINLGVVFEEEEPERIGTMTTNWEVSLVKMNKQFTYTFNGSKIF